MMAGLTVAGGHRGACFGPLSFFWSPQLESMLLFQGRAEGSLIAGLGPRKWSLVPRPLKTVSRRVRDQRLVPQAVLGC